MDLEHRVKGAIQELSEIQHAVETADAGATVTLPKLSDESLHKLKATVDRLRLSLWAYMESRSEPAHSDREGRIQAFRVERATEMLVALRTQMSKAGLGDETHARNLVHEIRTLAELTAGYGRKRTG